MKVLAIASQKIINSKEVLVKLQKESHNKFDAQASAVMCTTESSFGLCRLYQVCARQWIKIKSY